MIIINKQVSDIEFQGFKRSYVVKGGLVQTFIPDDEWEYILKNYGDFIRKNTFSDKNPTGFFVWTATEAKKAVAGVDVKASVDGMKWAELKKYAASLGVKVPRECGRAQLTEAVKEAEKNA